MIFVTFMDNPCTNIFVYEYSFMHIVLKIYKIYKKRKENGILSDTYL